MNPAELKSLVAQGAELSLWIKKQTDALDLIKAKLCAEASVMARTVTDSGAGQVVIEGEHGSKVKISYGGPRLTSALDPTIAAKVKLLSGDHFKKLFERVYTPIAGFRPVAFTLLGKTAWKVIELCSAPVGPRMSFEVV